MPNTNWRAWTGILIAIIGAAALFLNVNSPPIDVPPAPSGEGYHLDLTLMGKNLLHLPVGANDVFATRWAMRFALPFLAMFLGSFLLFLETDTGARFETYILKRLRKKDA